jgi:hypothetical protein
MSQPTLNYAPATQTPVRFWTLAAGSALLAFANLMPLLLALAFVLPLASNTRRILTSFVALILSSAVVAAVPLLARALPARRGHAPRYSVIACFILALAFALGRSTDGILALFAQIGPISTSRFFFGLALITFIYFFQAALLACAAAFLIITAARLKNTSLGIVAACALIPSMLYTITAVAYYVVRMGYTGPLTLSSMSFSQILTYAHRAHSAILFLLWASLALFAAIRAAKQPRLPASSSV